MVGGGITSQLLWWRFPAPVTLRLIRRIARARTDNFQAYWIGWMRKMRSTTRGSAPGVSRLVVSTPSDWHIRTRIAWLVWYRMEAASIICLIRNGWMRSIIWNIPLSKFFVNGQTQD